jgi:hypothetical protein
MKHKNASMENAKKNAQALHNAMMETRAQQIPAEAMVFAPIFQMEELFAEATAALHSNHAILRHSAVNQNAQARHNATTAIRAQQIPATAESAHTAILRAELRAEATAALAEKSATRRHLHARMNVLILHSAMTAIPALTIPATQQQASASTLQKTAVMGTHAQQTAAIAQQAAVNTLQKAATTETHAQQTAAIAQQGRVKILPLESPAIQYHAAHSTKDA